jgi:hypothetical protein
VRRNPPHGKGAPYTDSEQSDNPPCQTMRNFQIYIPIQKPMPGNVRGITGMTGFVYGGLRRGQTKGANQNPTKLRS